jgi:hypothetical protein
MPRPLRVDFDSISSRAEIALLPRPALIVVSKDALRFGESLWYAARTIDNPSLDGSWDMSAAYSSALAHLPPFAERLDSRAAASLFGAAERLETELWDFGGGDAPELAAASRGGGGVLCAGFNGTVEAAARADRRPLDVISAAVTSTLIDIIRVFFPRVPRAGASSSRGSEDAADLPPWRFYSRPPLG